MTTNDAEPTPPPAPAEPPPLPPLAPLAPPPLTLAVPSSSDPHAVAQPWTYPPPPGGPGAYPVPYWPAALLPPALPRVWPALVVPVLAIVLGAITSTATLVAAAITELGPDAMSNQQQFMDWVKTYGGTPRGFLVLLLPGQMVFLLAALGAALLSPEPLRRRLGLNRPSVPLWALPLLVLGTWFPGMCGDLLMSTLFKERGESLEMLYNLFRGPTGAFLVLVTLAISLMPGFGEEMLFRGYAQRRLLQRWHPAAAISASSLLFAVAHLDPAHVTGVIPLGIWFGVMAWLCGSIWPTILCHAANNAVAVLATNIGGAAATEPVPTRGAGLALWAVAGALCALSLWVMLRHRAASDPSKPGAVPAGTPQAFQEVEPVGYDHRRP